jgi:predicted amidohydrolase
VEPAIAIEQKANVFILSSAWPFPRIEHFRTLVSARAIGTASSQ